jgi:hypothetical protein
MNIELELPQDESGFLDRQCPSCDRLFRWHNGPVGEVSDDAPDSDSYHCPYCGQDAPTDEWWTAEQVRAIQAELAQAASELVRQGLDTSIRSEHQSGIHVAGPTRNSVPPPQPLLLEEFPSITVASPCHSYEPVKIAADWQNPIHCLVCGSLFIV